MRINQSGFAILGILVFALLTGCDSDKGTDLQDNINAAGFYAQFDPGNSVIPFPNNILFSGTVDGTLNIPTPAGASAGEIATINAVNALDGFSTSAPITASFNQNIKESSLVAGNTVRVFQTTLKTLAGPVDTIDRELEGLAANGSNYATAEYVATTSSVQGGGSTLVISPLRPLAAKASYLVTLSTGITNNSNEAAVADLIYAFIKSEDSLVDGGSSTNLALTDAEAAALEPLRVLTNDAEDAVESYTITGDSGGTITDLARDDIILSWTFTTQSIGDVLERVHSDIAGEPTPASAFDVAGPIDISPLGLPASVGSVADFYKGSVTINTYLDTSMPLTTSWTGLSVFDPSPTVIGTVEIPVLVSVPKGVKPVTGWPTVIFQHGITRERSVLLGVADGLAAAGFAAVAIDMPLHGLNGSAAVAILGVTGVTERNPDINTADATPDASGLYFINLTSLLTSRDNLRQAVADLFSLRQALVDMDYDSDGNSGGASPDFDLTNLNFVGHSLGAIVGSMFTQYETDVQHAVLAMPGGGIAKLLDGSAAFGPVVAAGLADAGLIKGTADYEQFMLLAQTVLDSADPVNYATSLGALNKGLLVLEITGETGNPSDLVIPNSVPDSNDTSGTIAAVLSGTNPFAALLGVQKTDASLASVSPVKAWVQFNKGHHGSFLTPNAADNSADAISAEVYTEMLSEMGSFLASGALALTVSADATNDIIRDQ